MKADILFIGVGGQGILTAVSVLGEAAVEAGTNVIMSEVHGMAQRGGTVEAHLRIGDVHSPLIPARGADAMVAFEPSEALRGVRMASRDSTVVVNTAPIYPFTVSLGLEKYPPLEEIMAALEGAVGKVVAFDALGAAREAGAPRSLNMVMLGALVGTGILRVSPAAVRQGISQKLKGPQLESALRAYDAGVEKASAASAR